MTKTNRKLILAVATITLLGVILSCQNPLTPAGLAAKDPANKPGTLVVQINSLTAKSLLPSIDMTPAKYILTGSGPSGSTFNAEATSSPAVITNLKFGDWTVTVDALNKDGTIIGRGQPTAPVTLHSGQNTSVTVTVKPLEGYGILNLTVTWNAASIEKPNINAQLVPATGSTLTLSFQSSSPSTATYSSSTIPTGYHTLVLQLQDGSTPVMGAVETVRIVKDVATSGTFDFQQINPADPQITVNITPQMNNPIAVTLAGTAKEITVGSSMTVTASVPAGTGNVIYTWYINGASKATGSSSYTVGSSLSAGFYRLDVTAIAADGSRAGSASHNFQVKSVQLTQANLIWDPNSEADLAGYKIYYGTSSKTYNSVMDVGNKTSYTLSGLQVGKTYYISATAYNTKGLESGYSNEVVFSGT
jgi:hypothetical protein